MESIQNSELFRIQTYSNRILNSLKILLNFLGNQKEG
jgi:hypothetical protein